jgi:hypothetical protein
VLAEGVELETMINGELLCAETEVVINEWIACNARLEGNHNLFECFVHKFFVQDTSLLRMGQCCFQQ